MVRLAVYLTFEVSLHVSSQCLEQLELPTVVASHPPLYLPVIAVLDRCLAQLAARGPLQLRAKLTSKGRRGIRKGHPLLLPRVNGKILVEGLYPHDVIAIYLGVRDKETSDQSRPGIAVHQAVYSGHTYVKRLFLFGDDRTKRQKRICSKFIIISTVILNFSAFVLTPAHVYTRLQRVQACT